MPKEEQNKKPAAKESLWQGLKGPLTGAWNWPRGLIKAKREPPAEAAPAGKPEKPAPSAEQAKAEQPKSGAPSDKPEAPEGGEEAEKAAAPSEAKPADEAKAAPAVSKAEAPKPKAAALEGGEEAEKAAALSEAKPADEAKAAPAVSEAEAPKPKAAAPEGGEEAEKAAAPSEAKPADEAKAAPAVSKAEAPKPKAAAAKPAAPASKSLKKPLPWEDKNLFEKKDDSPPLKLSGLFAFKLSMTAFYDESGARVPVTALKYKPWVISQIKTREKEGYEALQAACHPQKNSRCGRPLIGHLAAAGFKQGARHIKEIRRRGAAQKLPEGAAAGREISIESLKKGDVVRISGKTKGRGFAGVMKRWGFAGGKASHGSKSHRRTGSIGQHTEPARVMPGRKMPGRYGFRQLSRVSSVFDVLPEEGLILVRGPVPGARNSLISLEKLSG